MTGVIPDAAKGEIRVDDQEIRLNGPISGAKAGEARASALRPEAVAMGEPRTGDNVLRGAIDDVSFLGAIIRIKVRLKDHVISLDAFNNSAQAPPRRGEPATVSFPPADVQVLVEGEAVGAM